MTITTQPARNEYTANAAQTIFNYTFKIFENTDLNVYITPSGSDANDSTQLTTAYTVTGLGDEDGGTIILAVGTNANDLVTIVSDIPSNRTTDYQNNGDFRPPTVNDDFDRVVSIAKKIEDVANRTLISPQSQQNAQQLTLPAPESGRIMRWNTDESGLENIGISELDPSITTNDRVPFYFASLAEVVSSTDDETVKLGALITIGDRADALFDVVTLASLGGGVLGGFYEINLDGFPSLAIKRRTNTDVTTADVTYFVSPTGDDNNDGLTVGEPFLTINRAVAQVPVFIKHLVVIDLHSATVGVKTYNEDVLVSTAFRTMNIETGQYGGYSIVGDGADTKVQSMTCTKSDVSVTNFEIQQEAPIISAESGGIMFWWCSGEASASAITYAVGFNLGIAINCFASNVELRTINGDNTGRLLRAKRGSNVQIRFCLGAVDATAGGGIYDAAEVSKITIRDNTAVTRISGSWYDGDQGCEIHDYDRNRIMVDSIKQMVRMEATSVKIFIPNNFAGTTAPAAKVWSGRTAYEVENVFLFGNDGNNSGGVTANLYNDGVWRYAKDGAASIISLGDDIIISTAPAGLAGQPATLTEAFKIRNVDGRMFSTPTYNNTTANSPNMVVDATGIIQRSTSSMKYKKDPEPIDLSLSYALLDVEPIWYRSKCEGDNPDWSWYGFSAEQLETIDPRLVFYKTEESRCEIDEETGEMVTVITQLEKPEPEGVAYDRFVPHLLNIINDMNARIKKLEAK